MSPSHSSKLQRSLPLWQDYLSPVLDSPCLPQLHKLSSELGTWFSRIKTMLKDYISQPPLRCVWSHDCVTANTTRAEAMCLIPRVLMFLCLSSSSYVMQWQELLQPSWTMEWSWTCKLHMVEQLGSWQHEISCQLWAGPSRFARERKMTFLPSCSSHCSFGIFCNS